MHRFSLYIAVFLLALCFGKGASAAELRVVIYGDGLTAAAHLQPQEGIASLVQQKLKALGYNEIRVMNLSMDTYTSLEGAENVRRVLLQRPDVVVVAFGFNEMLNNGNPNQIYQSVGTILSTLSYDQQKPIFIILAGIRPPKRTDPSYASYVASIYATLAKHYKVYLVPDLLEGIVGDAKLTTADGLRPNAKGMNVMAENLYRYVDAGLRWQFQMDAYRQYQDDLKRYNLGLDSSQPLPKDPPPIPRLLPEAPKVYKAPRSQNR